MRRRAVLARVAGGRFDVLLREIFLRGASRNRARKRNFKRPYRGTTEAASRMSKQLLQRADGGGRREAARDLAALPAF
jgi:hypothetical protein